MADEKSKAARALRALARRVEHGLTKLEPVSEKHLAKVREAVRQHWAQTHPAQSQTTGSQTAPRRPAKTKQRQQQRSKSPSHDSSQSHDHGHGH